MKAVIDTTATLVILIAGVFLVKRMEKNNALHVPSKLIYSGIATLSLLFTLWEASNQGFWFDEFAQICYSGTGKTLLETLLIRDPTPPLFSLLANIWYNLMPYGQRWLLLLPSLFMAAAVYMTGLWGELLWNRRTGILSALMLGFSQMVIEQCGFEFRSYGLYIFLAATVLYLYAKKSLVGRNASWRQIIVLGLIFGILAYTHIYGAVLCFVCGIIDLYLCLTKKMTWRTAVTYLIAAGMFFPWFLYFLRGSAVVAITFDWMVSPSLWEAAKLIAYLCCNHIVYCLLFGIGVLYMVRLIISGGKNSGNTTNYYQVKLIPLAIIVLEIIIVYVYGINRSANASLWVKRYFTGLFPCVAVISAWGFDRLDAFLTKHTKKRAFLQTVCGLMLFSILSVSLYRTAAGLTPLKVYYDREAAEWLNEQSDIRNSETIVLSTLADYTPGWEEYYLTQKGRLEPVRTASLYALDEQHLMQYEIVYVVYNYPELTSEARELLTTNFVMVETNEQIHVDKYIRQDIVQKT
jgi:uncharacterized membrane protein